MLMMMKRIMNGFVPIIFIKIFNYLIAPENNNKEQPVLLLIALIVLDVALLLGGGTHAGGQLRKKINS